MVTVILPVHDERDNLAPLLEELAAALRGVAHEIVAVDDGSTDGSLAELKRLAYAYPALRVLALAERAGQSAALAAGVDAARGQIVATLDADGQNDPRDLRELLDALDRDPELDAAVGYRVGRRDSRWKKVQSAIARVVRNRLTGDAVRDTGCALKAMRRSALVHVPRFDGMHRFLPTLIRIAGGRIVELPVTHRPRRYGRTHYGMWNRALRGLRDALGVRWLKRRALRHVIREEI